jgi:hypothetical protein
VIHGFIASLCLGEGICVTRVLNESFFHPITSWKLLCFISREESWTASVELRLYFLVIFIHPRSPNWE